MKYHFELELNLLSTSIYTSSLLPMVASEKEMGFSKSDNKPIKSCPSQYYYANLAPKVLYGP